MRAVRGVAAGLALSASAFGVGAGCGDVIGLPSSANELSKVCFSCSCPGLEAQGDDYVAACMQGIDAELSATLGEPLSGVCDEGSTALDGREAQEGSVSGALRDAVDDGCASSCANLRACYGHLTGAKDDGACASSVECNTFACCANGVTVDTDKGVGNKGFASQTESQTCCQACSSCGEMLQAIVGGAASVSGCVESVPKLEALFDTCKPSACDVKCAGGVAVKLCLACIAENAGACADMPEASDAYVACASDLARPSGTP